MQWSFGLKLIIDDTLYIALYIIVIEVIVMEEFLM